MCWMVHVNGSINNRDLATSKLLNPEAFFTFMYTMHHLKILRHIKLKSEDYENRNDIYKIQFLIEMPMTFVLSFKRLHQSN